MIDLKTQLKKLINKGRYSTIFLINYTEVMLRSVATKLFSARSMNSAKMMSMRVSIMRPFSDGQHRIQPEVEERIMELSRRFLEKVRDAKIDKLTPTATFEELGMDSLDAVDFIVALEENFGFDISNEDAENRIRSIKDASVVFSEYHGKQGKDASGNSS